MPLRVTVEIIPHGFEDKKHTIGQLDITNTGKHEHRPEYGEYNFKLTGPVWGGDVDDWARGTLDHFKRSRGYWALVREILLTVDLDYQPEGEEG